MDRLPGCNFNNFELLLGSLIFSSKLYLENWDQFSLVSGSCSYRHSNETNKYITSVTGPFKLTVGLRNRTAGKRGRQNSA